MMIPRRAAGQSRRISASGIVHLFAPERPGQGRGFSRLAPVISRVRDLQLYEDAELARKNLESRLSVLASGDVSQMGDPDPTAEQPASKSGDLGDLAGGSIIQLPAGLNTTVVEPKAAPGYVEYVRHQLHVIAAGLGVPYELMTGDVSQTNYSSARVRILDFRRTVGTMQWHVVIPRLVERVCVAAMDAAVLGGVIGRADYKFDHSTPKWDYVNPEQDVKSDMLEIASGLTSWSEKQRQRGYTNPEAVLQEIQRDFAAMRGAGVLDVMLALQGRNQMDTQGDTTAGAAARGVVQDGGRTQAPVWRDGQAAAGQQSGSDDGVRYVQIRLDAPVVNVAPPEVRLEPTIHVQAPDVHVQPPIVNVQPPEVRVEAPVVNVHPPDVHVAPPVVNVAPPDVRVITPRRRITGIVERDEQGRVLSTTQIETDITDEPRAA
jgi:hypothetical protein